MEIIIKLLKLVRQKPAYFEDDLLTYHLCEFLREDRFKKSLDIAEKEGHFYLGMPANWRKHVACWAADIGKKLDGDFVECGVAYASTSRVVMEYIDFKNLNKKFYLIDTYEGLDERYLSLKDKFRNQSYKKIYTPNMYEFVEKAFKVFSNVIIIKGVVPEVLEQVRPEKVAYLHIDMNCVIPEIAAAEYFWNKMTSGAIVLLDDYGHKGYEEQHDAFDKFAKEKGVPILCLPTGQGIIIKP